MRLEAMLGLGGLLWCACGGSSQPGPAPRAVDPASGFSGLTTAVTITGDGFLARVDGGVADTRQRAWLGGVELEDVVRVDAHTLTATVPASLTPGPKDLRVRNAYGGEGTLADAFTVIEVPAALAASLTASRPTASLGQPFDVTFTVSNGGSGAADLASVSPSQSGAAATCGAVSPAPPVRIEAGGSQGFTWTCTGAAAGGLVLGATATGADVTSGAPLGLAADDVQVALQEPAALAATLGLDGAPDTLRVGQPVTLRLEVSDGGGAAVIVNALAVTPVEAGCGAPTPGPPRTVGGGLSTDFTFTCAPTMTGTLAPTASVRGQDGNTGGLLTAAAALVPFLSVQAPEALTVAIAASPTTVRVGDAVAATLTVTNAAGAPAATVVGVGPWSNGTGGATCSSVTIPPGTTVAAGAAVSFEWSCTATAAGDVQLGGTLSYTAGGASLSASTAVPLAVRVTP